MLGIGSTPKLRKKTLQVKWRSASALLYNTSKYSQQPGVGLRWGTMLGISFRPELQQMHTSTPQRHKLQSLIDRLHKRNARSASTLQIAVILMPRNDFGSASLRVPSLERPRSTWTLAGGASLAHVARGSDAEHSSNPSDSRFRVIQPELRLRHTSWTQASCCTPVWARKTGHACAS